MAIETVKTNCRFCRTEIWAQEDDPEPTCDECDNLETAMLEDSFAVEDSLRGLTQWEAA